MRRSSRVDPRGGRPATTSIARTTTTGSRPAWIARHAGGLDPPDRRPAIVARYLPGFFKDGLDVDAVDGAVQLLYDIPAIQVEHVRHEEPVLNTGFWRGGRCHP